ncbi:alpha-(1,3)-fucosyltransferase C isoform X2 [Procambarus clarkii]|uniref:alpha-(1,3)-fucosyltransferase C isoform X2 n=1 Tax=Procambarus clarkii TaxID=6728 RepID=UPI0037448A4E
MRRQIALLCVVTVVSVLVYLNNMDTLTTLVPQQPLLEFFDVLIRGHNLNISMNNTYTVEGLVWQRGIVEGDSNFPFEDNPISENLTSEPVDLYVERPRDKVNLDPDNPPLKKILFWNEVFDLKHFWFGFGREPFLRAGCRVNTCMTTGDRSRFPHEEIDALLWHFRSDDKSLPTQRSPHTRYVFWLMESPAHLFARIERFNQVFNWTFTYRLDSDFPLPYGRVYRRRVPEKPSNRNYAAGKTKMAAWLVSNCNTIGGRKHLIRTLRNWIKIDEFGKCGGTKCQSQQSLKCHSTLAADYKFYLSFENSLCRDYVTEKLFNVLRLDIVPVVYGLANYSQHAPPHSYIDALSFPTAKALADYLIYLDHNDTAYNEYFKWKRFHRLPIDWVNYAKPYCDLCERLHSDNSTKIYDLKKWFVDEAHCKTRNDNDIKAFIYGKTD